MNRLRHVKGKNLDRLQRDLDTLQQKVGLPFSILNVNNVSGDWYIHFVMNTPNNAVDNPITSKTEIAKPTQVKELN